MDCTFMSPTTTTIANIVACEIVSLGIPFEFFAIGVYTLFLLIAASSKLDFDFSLAGATILTWALMVMNGPAGNYMLQTIMGLLMLAIGIRLLIGLIAIFRQ